MFTNFKSIIEHIQSSGIKKTAAIAAAQDQDVLSSAFEARKLGIMDFVLVGDAEKIESILNELGSSPSDWEIIDEKDEAKAANIVAGMVYDKQVDMPVKGILHTSIYLKSLLNKERGLLADKALLSHVETFENTNTNKFLLVTDGVINVTPDYNDKIKIINNAVAFAHSLGIETPKVAVLAAVETVNPAMQECVDAAMLCKAADRGQIKGCEIDGPLALDLALSEEAAVTKGVKSAVAGNADILVVPSLVTGNILIKSIKYLAGFQSTGSMLGSKTPFIATSRSDSMQNKLNTIALSILQTM